MNNGFLFPNTNNGSYLELEISDSSSVTNDYEVDGIFIGSNVAVDIIGRGASVISGNVNFTVEFTTNDLQIFSIEIFVTSYPSS